MWNGERLCAFFFKPSSTIMLCFVLCMCGAVGDGLRNTVSWLSRAQQHLAVSAGAEQVSPLAVLHQAFVDLVTPPMPEPLPEVSSAFCTAIFSLVCIMTYT